jgi:UPF0755 protein
MTRAERNRKKKSCLPLYLTIVLLLLGGATAVVLAKIPADTASLFGQPVGTLSFFDRLSLSINLLSNQRDLLEPLDPAGAPVSFVIEDGDSVASIAGRMVSAGLIADADAWSDYLVYRGLDVSLQAGTYHLSPSLSPVGIAEYMQDQRSHEINFAILPGWRLEEIAASLPSSGLAITPEEFLSVTRNEGVSSLDGRLPAGLTSLEGYLLPGEYAVYRGATIAELLPLLLSRFFETIIGDLSLAFTNQGLSLDQAVILASMVEREAILDEEMPMIASVFLNRLAAGMRLESDPTVQYALGVDDLSAGWWKVPLDGGDLAVDSPFNTYLYGGLPPAPICNPSIGALQAVAYPAYSGNYFFRAACDGSGSHNFSATYEEHLNNACE